MSSTAHELVALVETAIEGMHTQFGIVGVQSQMPFAHHHAGVVVRQKRREDFCFWIKTTAAIASGVNAYPLLILAQHQPGASRRTNVATGVRL